MKQCPKCHKLHKEKTTFCLECLTDGLSEVIVETDKEYYKNNKGKIEVKSQERV